MAYYEFHWTDKSREHTAEHGITEEEYESIFVSPDDEGHSRTTGRPYVAGYLDDGRYIICFYDLDEANEDLIIPVTAYEL